MLRSAVLNPEGYRTIRAAGETAPRSNGSFSRMAPRLDDVKGKTIYLVDTGFGGSGKFLDQVQTWFAEQMPSVKTVRRRKTGNISATTPKTSGRKSRTMAKPRSWASRVDRAAPRRSPPAPAHLRRNTES